MKLEDQVTSLELSKKLKELGVKQESLFYWCKGEDFLGVYGDSQDFFTFDNENLMATDFWESCDHKILEKYSAFTASELYALIPKTIKNNYGDILCFYTTILDCGDYTEFCTYYSCSGSYEDLISYVGRDINLSNCISKTLIHLIENKLMEIK